MYSFDPIRDIRCRLQCLRYAGVPIRHVTPEGELIIRKNDLELRDFSGKRNLKGWLGLTDEMCLDRYDWVLHNSNVITFYSRPDILTALAKKTDEYRILLCRGYVEYEFNELRGVHAVIEDTKCDERFSILRDHLTDDILEMIGDQARYLGYTGTLSTVNVREDFTHVMPDDLFECIQRTISSHYCNVAKLFQNDPNGYVDMNILVSALKSIDVELPDKLEYELGEEWRRLNDIRIERRTEGGNSRG